MELQLYKGKDDSGEIVEGSLVFFNKSLYIVELKGYTDMTFFGSSHHGVCPNAISVTNVEKSRVIEIVL